MKFARILGSAAILAASVVALPSAASAICFVNESDRAMTFQVWHNKKAWKRSSWSVKLKPGRQSCCTGHRVCTGRRVYFTAYYWAPVKQRRQWRKFKRVRLLKFGKMFLPVQGELPQTSIRLGPCARTAVPGNRQIRVFGRVDRGTQRFACEVWRGARLEYTTWWRDVQKPRLRGHVVTCNRTAQSLSTVMAYFDRARRAWRTVGWHNVKPGACRVVVPPRGYRGDIYVHGQTKKTKWKQNDAYFCVNPRASFNLIRADRRACPPGYRKVGFLKRRPPGGKTSPIHYRAPAR